MRYFSRIKLARKDLAISRTNGTYFWLQENPKICVRTKSIDPFFKELRAPKQMWGILPRIHSFMCTIADQVQSSSKCRARTKRKRKKYLVFRLQVLGWPHGPSRSGPRCESVGHCKWPCMQGSTRAYFKGGLF